MKLAFSTSNIAKIGPLRRASSEPVKKHTHKDDDDDEAESKDFLDDLIRLDFHGLFRRRRLHHAHGVGRREDALQFFKEEKTQEAVYAVYLKKVRYHTPADDVGITFTAPSSTPSLQRTNNPSSNIISPSRSRFYLNIPGSGDDEDDRKAHLQWRLEEVHVIKQGTLGKLVEALSSGTGEIDSTYVNTFLATYRSFASPHNVMKLLFERTIKIVLSVWLDTYPEDFKESPDFSTLTLLITEAAKQIPDSDLAQRAREKFMSFLQEEEPEGPISVDDIDFNMDFRLASLEEADLLMGTSYMAQPMDFNTVKSRFFAEQLTYLDAELFKKVIPHHCLGSIWSRRGKKHGGCNAPTVYATVNQFNAVSYRVIATILKNPNNSPMERSLVVQKWIDIAQECRVLKNFSSLKAIISGLQSNAVYRLHSVWNLLERDAMALFEELSDIFSDENNQLMAREVLNREGTAKFADPETTNTIRGHKRNKSWGFSTTRARRSMLFDVQPSTIQGTVPYLGTFLTDLTMIDTAIKDHTDNNLINFDKKRKEFEHLAQIKLLQSAAHLYNIKPDRRFHEWFQSIRTYDDNESYELSCEIEPVNQSTPKEVKGHRRKSSLGFFSPRRPAQSMENLHISDSTPTLRVSDDTGSVISQPEPTTPISGPRPNLKHSISVGSLRSVDSEMPSSPWKSPETIVAKVFLETADNHTTNYYKSILLANSDHTRKVITNVLEKYNISANTDDYILFQVLENDKELQIPEKGNVFYAISTSVPEIQFVMRKKSELERLKARHLKSKARRKKLTL